MIASFESCFFHPCDLAHLPLRQDRTHESGLSETQRLALFHSKARRLCEYSLQKNGGAGQFIHGGSELFAIKRFFRSLRSQPRIRELDVVDAFLRAEQDEAAWQRVRSANRERQDSPSGVNQEGDLPLVEAPRLSRKQVPLHGQQRSNNSVGELDTD